MTDVNKAHDRDIVLNSILRRQPSPPAGIEDFPSMPLVQCPIEIPSLIAKQLAIESTGQDALQRR